MSSMFAAFDTDKTKETKGIEINFGNFRVTARRAGGANKMFQKTMEAIVAPYQRVIKLGTVETDTMKELLAEGYAKAVIINWEYPKQPEDGLGEAVWTRGIELEDGTIGEPTVDAVKSTLIRYPDIFETIKEVVDNFRNFRTENDEAAKGN